MNLYASGRINGVRSKPDVTNRETGEVTPSMSKLIDIYDEHTGPGVLEAPIGLDVPPPGTVCTFLVAVRAYSGFVRNGQAGDARVSYTVTQITPVEAGVPSSNGRAKQRA